MAKKQQTKNSITIECDSNEVYVALINFLVSYQDQFAGELKNILTRSQIENDASFVVNPVTGTVKASYKTTDKGSVLTAKTSDSVSVVKHKTLEIGDVYAVPSNGQFLVYKRAKKVDKLAGHFPTWNSLVSGLATVPVPADEAATPADPNMQVVE